MFSYFCYILPPPRGTCFTLNTHIPALNTQFWLCSPQNFMKCLLNTPISLHITTSLLKHQLCYLTPVSLLTHRTHKIHQKALWEGGTWHSQICLHNHSFRSHGCSYIKYMKFQRFRHVELFTMPDYIDTPLSMFISEYYIYTS